MDNLITEFLLCNYSFSLPYLTESLSGGHWPFLINLYQKADSSNTVKFQLLVQIHSSPERAYTKTRSIIIYHVGHKIFIEVKIYFYLEDYPQEVI